MPGNVMVVEDDPQLCDMLTRFIAESGFPVRSARSAREAIAQFDDVDPRVVILDLKLPDGDGLDLLRLFKRRLPGCKIVIMSSYSDVDTVVEAMRLGAENYLTKPTPLPELRVLIDHLLDEPGSDAGPRELAGVIGRSPVMQEVYRMVRKVAATKATVLIRGGERNG
jgi:DNA-binding NtrC family response regulator